jgi:hypothetical protein
LSEPTTHTLITRDPSLVEAPSRAALGGEL